MKIKTESTFSIAGMSAKLKIEGPVCPQRLELLGGYLELALAELLLDLQAQDVAARPGALAAPPSPAAQPAPLRVVEDSRQLPKIPDELKTPPPDYVEHLSPTERISEIHRLPIRILNILENAGLYTVGKVRQKSQRDLLIQLKLTRGNLRTLSELGIWPGPQQLAEVPMPADTVRSR